ncbi:golgin candidate 2-like [Olea europaea var. sylvestris]|uniref:golgin candidate 2-like n=1 Tax=Olea europaea var. sylvestris TaxID=158386 RepID=UPI000C1D70F3|nr:golgin candidate 2-like [Olea europaea var. sylvestris]
MATQLCSMDDNYYPTWRQQASELQTSMMEIMEATDLEKQKLNNTRIEALVRLSKLATANADLARSLAVAQKNLEIECKIEGEGIVMRKLNLTYYHLLHLQEVRHQCGGRNFLGYLFLVEALSSKKAMLLFRIKAVSRLLDENKLIVELADFPGTSSKVDLESSVWEPYNSKFRPLVVKKKTRSSQQHLGSLIRQLDSIFSTSVIFLRRNSTAGIWSGAVVSLENINNTGGV